MPASRPPTPLGRYIVRAASDDNALVKFLATLSTEPGVQVVDLIGPSSGPPHTAVVETDVSTAERLRQQTLDQLTIEPDQPLSLFD
ncbi:hypothetical protein AB2N08_22725 [Massilia aurea]|uniref:hypothetical protein n=1 Tax=Massilia aurea TaxID=373040 RepID=UPI003461EEF9